MTGYLSFASEYLHKPAITSNLPGGALYNLSKPPATQSHRASRQRCRDICFRIARISTWLVSFVAFPFIVISEQTLPEVLSRPLNAKRKVHIVAFTTPQQQGKISPTAISNRGPDERAVQVEIEEKLAMKTLRTCRGLLSSSVSSLAESEGEQRVYMWWLIAGDEERASVGRDQTSGRRTDRERARGKGQVTEWVCESRQGEMEPSKQNKGKPGASFSVRGLTG